MRLTCVRRWRGVFFEDHPAASVITHVAQTQNAEVQRSARLREAKVCLPTLVCPSPLCFAPIYQARSALLLFASPLFSRQRGSGMGEGMWWKGGFYFETLLITRRFLLSNQFFNPLTSQLFLSAIHCLRAQRSRQLFPCVWFVRAIKKKYWR